MTSLSYGALREQAALLAQPVPSKGRDQVSLRELSSKLVFS